MAKRREDPDPRSMPPDVEYSKEDQERQTYLRTRQELSDQIASMEQQLQTVKRQRLQAASVPTSEISKQLLQSGAEQLDKALRDIAQGKTLHDAHEDLSALAAFTGIEFDYVTNLLLPVSSPLTRRYAFRGRAYGLSFRLQVDVRDDNLEILHLRPSLSPELTLALNDFLHSVQKERALRLFFKSFANFARAASERHTTFAAIKSKYGDSVRLPRGYLSHRLLFEGHPKSGFNFAVEWNLSVDQSGAILHNISLLPRFSTELTGADRKNEVLAGVSEQFRMMVAQRGVQAAVEITAALARLEQ